MKPPGGAFNANPAVPIPCRSSQPVPRHPPTADYVVEVAAGQLAPRASRAVLGMKPPGGAFNANPAVPTLPIYRRGQLVVQIAGLGDTVLLECPDCGAGRRLFCRCCSPNSFRRDSGWPLADPAGSRRFLERVELQISSAGTPGPSQCTGRLQRPRRGKKRMGSKLLVDRHLGGYFVCLGTDPRIPSDLRKSLPFNPIPHFEACWVT